MNRFGSFVAAPFRSSEPLPVGAPIFSDRQFIVRTNVFRKQPVSVLLDSVNRIPVITQSNPLPSGYTALLPTRLISPISRELKNRELGQNENCCLKLLDLFLVLLIIKILDLSSEP